MSSARADTAGQHFSPSLFAFLRELRDKNSRDWFEANRERYEETVREPALAFIAGFAARLQAISPHFVADPRPQGGSLFRIHRDTRFSKDKTPYKTNVGIHFRHEAGKDAHAPGFYLHLAPRDVVAGAGIWRPDTAALTKIRGSVVADEARWRRATAAPKFSKLFTLEGESLKRVPAGFAPDHPLADDLRRKDLIAVTRPTERAATTKGFADALAESFGAASPFMAFLCEALGLPF